MLIMRLFILLIIFHFASAAFQLDTSCLKRPQACNNDAFSTADFMVCGGSYPIKENALTGSGYKSDVNRTCPGGITEWCVSFGPGDEIIINLWGETEFRQVLTVNREGFIFIPDIGQVFVNGLNFSLLESKLAMCI
mgnify:CR=1 FL=1